MQKIHSGTLALFVVASMLPCGRAEADTRGYRNPLVPFGLIVAIDPATGANAVPPEHAMCNFEPPNVVFSAGFITGWAYGGDTLYMVQSGPPDALGFLDTSVVGCGSRIAIGANTGFGGLAALAYCAADGMLYSQTFAGHDGQLVRIDPVSGVGTLVGSAMPTNVRMTEMDCDAAGELWAITDVFDTRPSELYRVNRSTGVATLACMRPPARTGNAITASPATHSSRFSAKPRRRAFATLPSSAHSDVGVLGVKRGSAPFGSATISGANAR